MTNRSRARGYAGSHYPFLTLQERDIETSLFYFHARYYSASQGRFISPDQFGGSGFVSVPQSWNKYTYCLNRPFVFTDPTGQIWLTEDNQNFIWIPDAIYKKNRNDYKGYSIANGAVTKYGSSTNCPQCANLKNGQWIQLNEDSSVTPVSDPSTYIYPQYTDDEVFNPLPAILGTYRQGRYPDLHGPKGGMRSFDRGNGKHTDRWYDGEGNAWVDLDYGDGEPQGDPHVHWWDWNYDPPRRSPGEAPPEGWERSLWDNGDPFINPNRPNRQPFSPYGIPVYPMTSPSGIPIRPSVPFRPMVPLRPILVLY